MDYSYDIKQRTFYVEEAAEDLGIQVVDILEFIRDGFIVPDIIDDKFVISPKDIDRMRNSINEDLNSLDPFEDEVAITENDEDDKHLGVIKNDNL